jgi:hypothetical protein
MNNLKDYSWYLVYAAAVVETDSAQMPNRIRAARKALDELSWGETAVEWNLNS